MESIRILNDESRFYIVFDNPTQEDKAAALEFVAKRLGIQKVEEEKPISLLPNKVEPYAVPEEKEDPVIEEVKIPYIGTKKLFIEWYKKYDLVPENQKDEWFKKLGFFISKYEKRVKKTDIEKVKEFLLDFEEIFKNRLGEIMKMNGYNDLRIFLDKESNNNILAAYDSCKSALFKALKIEN